jgi:regulator of replication initiation timing
LEAAVIGFIGECSQHPAILQAAEESSRLRAKASRKPLRTALSAAEQSLSEVAQKLRNCAEAVAVGGLEAMAEELREQAASLRAEKQHLLVECERLRQDLSASDQDQLDAVRLRQSLEKFSEVLPTLSHDEQRNLVTLFIANIEIRQTASPEVSTTRNFELRIKFQMSRLIAGMEEKVVVQARPKTRGPLPPVRLLALDMKCAVAHSNSRSPVMILAPFRKAVVTADPGPCPASRPLQHPLLRAIAWQRQLASRPGMTQAMLAKNAGVTAGTLTHHLKLLRLAAEIQEFLLNVKTEPELRRFSLNRMKELANLPHRQQLQAFAVLRKSEG